MLKNGQKYFKNLAVFTLVFKVCLAIFQHYAIKGYFVGVVRDLAVNLRVIGCLCHANLSCLGGSNRTRPFTEQHFFSDFSPNLSNLIS